MLEITARTAAAASGMAEVITEAAANKDGSAFQTSVADTTQVKS